MAIGLNEAGYALNEAETMCGVTFARAKEFAHATRGGTFVWILVVCEA